MNNYYNGNISEVKIFQEFHKQYEFIGGWLFSIGNTTNYYFLFSDSESVNKIIMLKVSKYNDIVITVEEEYGRLDIFENNVVYCKENTHVCNAVFTICGNLKDCYNNFIIANKVSVKLNDYDTLYIGTPAKVNCYSSK